MLRSAFARMVNSSYNDYRRQCQTIDSRAKVRSYILTQRECFLLISTEIERGRRTGIQERDGCEHDCFARYILDKTKPDGGHAAAYCLTPCLIGNESHEVRPAPVNQETREQAQNKSELLQRTHMQKFARDPPASVSQEKLSATRPELRV